MKERVWELSLVESLKGEILCAVPVLSSQTGIAIFHGVTKTVQDIEICQEL